MPSRTVERLEELATSVFREATTGPAIGVQLRAIAADEPTHPMPALAQAFVEGLGARNLTKMREFLERGGNLIGSATVGISGSNLEVARAVHDALAAEAILVENRPCAIAGDRGDALLRERAAERMTAALQQLDEYSPTADGAMLWRVLRAALRALSIAYPPGGTVSQAGLADLEASSQADDPQALLAKYFLIFGYRRTGRTSDAVRIAAELHSQHPEAVIPHLVLASCLAASGEYLPAEREVRALVHRYPDDSSLRLSQAVLLRKANRLDEASSVLQDITVETQSRKLARFIDMETRLIRRATTVRPG
jgi:hypothetical protein